MAILDWPTSEGFTPMSPVLIGATTPKSSFVGAYSGERTTSSRLADRMVMEFTLPTTTAALGRKRAAWIKSLASTGDQVRMPAWPQRYRRGTMSGSPTVTTTAAAGLRSLTLGSVLAAPNLFFGSGFEIDTNADGLADGWTQYSTGTTGTITKSRVAGNGSTWAQRFDATGLGSTASDQVGLYYTAEVVVTAGLSYTLSADTRDNGVSVRVHIDWYSAAPAIISSSTAVALSSGSVWTRRTVTGVAPAGAVKARPYVWMESKTGGPAAAAVEIDNAQFEQSAAATSYAGLATALAGDVVGIGGNLLEVGPTDCTATDAGVLTLGLALPTLRSISSGATVTTTNATGVWQLDEINAPMMGYEAGAMQGPVALTFRQVAQ